MAQDYEVFGTEDANTPPTVTLGEMTRNEQIYQQFQQSVHRYANAQYYAQNFRIPLDAAYRYEGAISRNLFGEGTTPTQANRQILKAEAENLKKAGAPWLTEIDNALARGGLRTFAGFPGTAASAVYGLKALMGHESMWMLTRWGPLAGARRKLEASGIEDRLKLLAREIYSESEMQSLAQTRGGVMGYIVNTLGDTAPMMALAAVAGVATGGMGAFGVAFATEGEAAYQEAMRSLEGRDDLTMEQKRAIAETERVIVGTINGLIEQMQIDQILKIGKHLAPEVKALIKARTWAAVLKHSKNLTMAQLMQALNEGTEETLQELVSIGAATMHGDRIEFADLDRLPRAFVGGATAGFAFGVVSTVGNVAATWGLEVEDQRAFAKKHAGIVKMVQEAPGLTEAQQTEILDAFRTGSEVSEATEKAVAKSAELKREMEVKQWVEGEVSEEDIKGLSRVGAEDLAQRSEDRATELLGEASALIKQESPDLAFEAKDAESVVATLEFVRTLAEAEQNTQLIKEIDAWKQTYEQVTQRQEAFTQRAAEAEVEEEFTFQEEQQVVAEPLRAAMEVLRREDVSAELVAEIGTLATQADKKIAKGELAPEQREKWIADQITAHGLDVSAAEQQIPGANAWSPQLQKMVIQLATNPEAMTGVDVAMHEVAETGLKQMYGKDIEASEELTTLRQQIVANLKDPRYDNTKSNMEWWSDFATDYMLASRNGKGRLLRGIMQKHIREADTPTSRIRRFLDYLGQLYTDLLKAAKRLRRAVEAGKVPERGQAIAKAAIEGPEAVSPKTLLPEGTSYQLRPRQIEELVTGDDFAREKLQDLSIEQLEALDAALTERRERLVEDAATILIDEWPDMGEKLGLTYNDLISRGPEFMGKLMWDIRRDVSKQGGPDSELHQRISEWQAQELRAEARQEMVNERLAELKIESGYQLRPRLTPAAEANRQAAVKKAMAQATQQGTPLYVYQRADGSFATSQKIPARGHYTVVDPTQPAGQQVRMVKQASETAEEAFEPDEAQREDMKHLTPLARFKQQLKQKNADADAIVQEIGDYIRANVPSRLAGQFNPLIVLAAQSKRQIKTKQKDLMRAIARVERVLGKDRQAQAIDKYVNTLAAIKAKFRRGKAALARLDAPTRAKILSLVEGIDTKTLSKKKRARLESLDRHLRTLGERVITGLQTLDEYKADVLSIPLKLQKEMERLRETPLSEMTPEEIDTVRRAIEKVVNEYERKGQLKQAKEVRELKEDLGTAEDQMHYEKGYEAEGTRVEGRSWFRRWSGTHHMHANTLIEFLTNVKDSVLKRRLFDDINDANRRRALIGMVARGVWRRHVESIGWTPEDTAKAEEDRVITIGGQEIAVSGMHIMSLIMMSQDNEVIDGMLNEKQKGFWFTDKKGHVNRAFYDWTEIAKLYDHLSAKELQYMEGWRIVNDVLRPYINETSREMGDGTLAYNPEYYPTHRHSAAKVGGATPALQSIAMEQRGPWQPRTGGIEAYEVKRFDYELINTIENSAMYAGLTIPMQRARVFLNNPDLATKYAHAGKAAEWNELVEIFNRVQSRPTSSDALDSMGKQVLARVTQSILSMRLRTIGTQFGSFPMMFLEVDSKYWSATASENAAQQVLDHSPILSERFLMGRVNAEMGDAAALEAADMFLHDRMTVRNRLLRGMAWADKKTILAGVGTAEAEVKGTQPETMAKVAELKAEAEALKAEGKTREAESKQQDAEDVYWDAVARRVEHYVFHGQPNWDILHRSVLSTSPSTFARTLMIFRTALEAQMNAVMRGRIRARNANELAARLEAQGKTAEAAAVREQGQAELYKAYALVGSSVGLVSAWRAVFSTLMSAGAVATLAMMGMIDPDDDDDELLSAVAKRWAAESFTNVFTILPFGNLFSSGATVMERTAKALLADEPVPHPKYFFREDMISQLATDAKQGFYDWIMFAKYVKDDEDEKAKAALYRALEGSFGIAAKATGLPFSAPMTEFVYPVRKALKENEKSTGGTAGRRSARRRTTRRRI